MVKLEKLEQKCQKKKFKWKHVKGNINLREIRKKEKLEKKLWKNENENWYIFLFCFFFFFI